jgi:5'-3' exonuclease
MSGLILIDGSNLSHIANNGAQLSVGDMPTQAIYGILEQAIRPMIGAYPMMTPIVLWDGVSWRKQFFEEYKANRDKEPETANEQRVLDQKIALRKQMPFIKQALKHLGIRQMIAANLEADDLAGMMVKRYAEKQRIMLVSGDKDWIQLVRPNVAIVDPISGRRITHKNIRRTGKTTKGVSLSMTLDGLVFLRQKLGSRSKHSWVISRIISQV